MVIPLVSPRFESDGYSFGSGFLLRINSQNYLVTVAHLANFQLAPSGDWSLWQDQLSLVDESCRIVRSLMLFDEDHEGKRVPRFKYSWRSDPSGSIQDIILLPLQSDDPLLKTYSTFDLPTDRANHELGARVTMLGRRNEFPALSAAEHFLTFQAGPARFMTPEGLPGDSGGPVVTSSRLLLGMNVGTHRDFPGQGMLISTEGIEAIAAAVNGVAEAWPRFESEPPNEGEPELDGTSPHRSMN